MLGNETLEGSLMQTTKAKRLRYVIMPDFIWREPQEVIESDARPCTERSSDTGGSKGVSALQHNTSSSSTISNNSNSPNEVSCCSSFVKGISDIEKWNKTKVRTTVIFRLLCHLF